VTTHCTQNDLHMHITHLRTLVGVTDAPPNGVVAKYVVPVRPIFSPNGVGGKIGRAEEAYVQTLCSLWERSVQQSAAADSSQLTAQIFI
jgi:hypothetical protein